MHELTWFWPRGTYKLNIAKSSYTPAPNPVQDLTVTRELSSGGITQTTDGTLAGNVPFHASYTTNGDGVEVPVTGTRHSTPSR